MIKLKPETKEKLEALAEYGDTMDKVINRLILCYEKVDGCKEFYNKCQLDEIGKCVADHNKD